MVLAGKRCPPRSAAADPINVASCGVKLRVALILLADVPCARLNPKMGMRWVVGRDAMGATVVQREPCRIMARVSGPGMLALVVRAVGASGRRFR